MRTQRSVKATSPETNEFEMVIVSGMKYKQDTFVLWPGFRGEAG